MKLLADRSLLFPVLMVLTGCASAGVIAQPPQLPAESRSGPAADYPMTIGQPYTVNGVNYVPSDTLNYDAVGMARVGNEGGSGISVAHHTMPVPSYAEVTSLDSGRTILVRVERRGPMDSTVLVELSPGAAAQLGVAMGTDVAVRIRRVNPPEQERAALRNGQAAAVRMDTPASLVAVLRRRLTPNGSDLTRAAVPAPGSGVVPPAVKPGPAAAPNVISKTPPAPPARSATVAPGKPDPAPAAKPDGAQQAGTLFVQVGAYSTRERAAAAAAEVGGKVSPVGKLWRVRAGPFATQAQAGAALAKVKAAGYSDARIQRGN